MSLSYELHEEIFDKKLETIKLEFKKELRKVETELRQEQIYHGFFKDLSKQLRGDIDTLRQENRKLELTLELEQRNMQPKAMDNEDRTSIVVSLIELIEAAQQLHPEDIFTDEVVTKMEDILDPWCTNEYRNYN